MKIKIEIDTSTFPIQVFPWFEVSRILRKHAADIEGLPQGYKGGLKNIMGSNGEVVSQCIITEDKEDTEK